MLIPSVTLLIFCVACRHRLGEQVCKNQLEVGEGAKLEMIKEVSVSSSKFCV